MATVRIILILLATVTALPVHSYARTIIHAKSLIDGINDKPREQVSIVIEEGRFTQVVDGYITPGEGDGLIDLTRHTVMPGLMDMHTHLSFEFSRKTYSEGILPEPHRLCDSIDRLCETYADGRIHHGARRGRRRYGGRVVAQRN
jgi:predicted amidohydrolase YtcJ